KCLPKPGDESCRFSAVCCRPARQLSQRLQALTVKLLRWFPAKLSDSPFLAVLPDNLANPTTSSDVTGPSRHLVATRGPASGKALYVHRRRRAGLYARREAVLVWEPNDFRDSVSRAAFIERNTTHLAPKRIAIWCIFACQEFCAKQLDCLRGKA